MSSLRAHAARLFAHYDPEALKRSSSRPFVALRLAEEGDLRDLRWLVSTTGEPELTRLLQRHGSRQLSRRSQSFWSLILGLAGPAAGGDSGDEAIWPL